MTASDVFAERAKALNDLAAQAITAKAQGDTVGLAKVMAQYQMLRSQSSLSQLATQAKVAEMPSAFMQNLAGVSDKLVAAGISAGEQTLGIFKNLPLLLLLLGVGYFVVVSGLAGKRRSEW